MSWIESVTGGSGQSLPVCELADHTIRITVSQDSNYNHVMKTYLDEVLISTNSSGYYGGMSVITKTEGNYATEGGYNIQCDLILNGTGTQSTLMYLKVTLNGFLLYQSSSVGLSSNIDSGNVTIK